MPHFTLWTRKGVPHMTLIILALEGFEGFETALCMVGKYREVHILVVRYIEPELTCVRGESFKTCGYHAFHHGFTHARIRISVNGCNDAQTLPLDNGHHTYMLECDVRNPSNVLKCFPDVLLKCTDCLFWCRLMTSL